MLRIRSGFLSVTGNVRDNNEDRCEVDSSGRYFLVADGMGGQSAGERASALAVEIVPKELRRLINFDKDGPGAIVKSIDKAIETANAEIMALGEVDPALHNMGTTIAFVIAAANQLYVGGVGDSRVYMLRKATLDRLTKDHSLTQALIDAKTLKPEDAATHKFRNVLYRFLGTKEGGTGTDPRQIAPQVGDRYMICSDGVNDGITDEQIHQLLKSMNDPQEAAKAIVQAALDGGSRDNVTCVVLHVEKV